MHQEIRKNKITTIFSVPTFLNFVKYNLIKKKFYSLKELFLEEIFFSNKDIYLENKSAKNKSLMSGVNETSIVNTMYKIRRKILEC